MTDRGRAGRTGTGQTLLLALAAIVLTLLWFRGCVGVLGDGHYGFPWVRMYAPLGIWGLISALLGVWVGVDANRRGLNGLLWGLLVFFTGIIGLIVYLLVGPSMTPRQDRAATGARAGFGAAPPAARCPQCQATTRAEFQACPFCTAPVGS